MNNVLHTPANLGEIIDRWFAKLQKQDYRDIAWLVAEINRKKQIIESISATLTEYRTQLESSQREQKSLRETLLTIQKWDCLNPPDRNLCFDHPWLKRLVDDALIGRLPDPDTADRATPKEQQP